MGERLIRLGIQPPPTPYPVRFERRAGSSTGRMACADMVGVGANTAKPQHKTAAAVVLTAFSEMLNQAPKIAGLP